MKPTCTPLLRCRKPAYPTKLEVIDEPDLLLKNLPSAWLGRAEMTGALSLCLAVSTTGCSDRSTGTDSDSNHLTDKAAIVAPIFHHGEGRGATGCVVISPPAFLSEEEAVLVISEELSAQGVDVSKREIDLESVTIPTRMSPGIEIIKTPGASQPLKADIWDAKRRIAVEFVSVDDYFALGGLRDLCTVKSYDFGEVAGYVGNNVKKKGKGVYFGAFYDPVSSCSRDFVLGESAEDRLKRMKTAKKLAEAESKRLLRQQVKDFVDWLKAQGVL